MRIFIVDDEPSVVEMVAKVCAQDGHDVAGVSTSLEAIDYLAANSVDLLIVDAAMPPPDGLQLIREARSTQPNLMAIAMTGHQGRHSMAELQSAGATDLIYKPLRMDELRARVTFADQRRRMIEGLNARRRELQQMSADMIKALQEELEEVRRSARAARGGKIAAPDAVDPSRAAVPS